ncbi:hypothetical protein HA402_009563, partial [Bradysia odoriphaga]
ARETQGIDVDVKDMINTKIMGERIPNLGLVIDLTNTRKYYDSKNVTDQGIEYKKIFVPGQRLPAPHIYEEFMSTVTDFLRRNAENDKLIGVHCTHGLNRTGLMVCAHMIQKCNIDPVDAVERFEAARGHKMERENYVESLKTMTAKLHVAEEIEISHGNSRTVSTQTNPGIWLDTKISRKRRSTVDIADVRSVKGTVYVDGSNLISDGAGRYFMQVDLNDVRPLRSMSNTHSDGHHTYSNQRFYPPRGSNGRQDSNRSNSSQAYQSNRSISYRPNHRLNGPNPNGTYFSNQSPYSSDRSYGVQPNFYDTSNPFKS